MADQRRETDADAAGRQDESDGEEEEGGEEGGLESTWGRQGGVVTEMAGWVEGREWIGEVAVVVKAGAVSEAVTAVGTRTTAQLCAPLQPDAVALQVTAQPITCGQGRPSSSYPPSFFQ